MTSNEKIIGIWDGKPFTLEHVIESMQLMSNDAVVVKYLPTFQFAIIACITELKKNQALQEENQDLRDTAADCTDGDHQAYCRHYKGLKHARALLEAELVKANEKIRINDEHEERRVSDMMRMRRAIRDIDVYTTNHLSGEHLNELQRIIARAEQR